MSGPLDRPMYAPWPPSLYGSYEAPGAPRKPLEPRCPPWCETVRPPGPGVLLWRWLRRKLGMRVEPRLCRGCTQQALDWLFKRAREGR